MQTQSQTQTQMPSSSSVDSNPFSSPSLSPTLGPSTSTSTSTSTSPTASRRLSVRRGSIAAVDPWGEHADVNLNPARTTSSRLTIVRVPPPPPPATDSTEEGRRHHRRHGSNTSLGADSGGRMSFAFTSFAPSKGEPTSGRASPPSPRMRPSTPGSPRQSVSLPPQKPKLTPEQLVDLAKQSVNPRPTITAGSPNAPQAPAQPAPVSFTPLPESIYLPFIDRPMEVSQLMCQPSVNKLFALLAQTFPDTRPSPSPPSPPASSGVSTSPSDYILSTVPSPSPSSDPKLWSYSELVSWIRNVDRDVADDVLWVRNIRTCILEHSELIWERIRGAFGVPPELNVDDEEFYAPLPHHHHLPEPAGIDEGAAGAAPVPGAVPIPRPKPSAEGLEAALNASVFEPESPVSPTVPLSTTSGSVPAYPIITAATPPLSALSGQEPSLPSGEVVYPSSVLEHEYECECEFEEGGSEVSVEPVIASVSPPAGGVTTVGHTHGHGHPPFASVSARSLSEVLEEEEEEEEECETKATEGTQGAEGAEEKAAGKDRLDVDANNPEIVGLRFSTSPVPPPPATALGIVSSNSPSSVGSGVGVAGSLPRSPVVGPSTSTSAPSAGIAAAARGAPMQGLGRSSSFGSVASGMSGVSAVSAGSALSGVSGGSSEFSYDANLERGPGRPLFPSNFAQLSLGPTLRSRRAHSVSYPTHYYSIHRNPPLHHGRTNSQSQTRNQLGPGALPASASRSTGIDIPGSGSALSAEARGGMEFDMERHEYAVSTGSAGGVDG